MKSLSVATISACCIAIGVLLAVLGVINGQVGGGIAWLVIMSAVSIVLASVASQMRQKEVTYHCRFTV